MKIAEPTVSHRDRTRAETLYTAETAEPPAEESGRALFAVLRHYRWLILVIPLAFAAFATYYTHRLRPTYTAQALTALNVDKTNGLSLEELNTQLPGGTESDLRLETEVHILESDSLGIDVIKQLNLGSDPDFGPAPTSSSNSTQNRQLGIWHSALQVKIVPKTKLIQVSFSSHNPETAAKVVNALLNAYVSEGQVVRMKAAEAANQSLAEQLAGARQLAEAAENRLTEYQNAAGIVLLPNSAAGQDGVLNRVEDLNRAYTAAQVVRIEKQAAYQQMQTKNPEMLANLTPDSVLSTLREQKANLGREIAEVDAKFGSEYPRSKQLHSAMKQLDASIAAESTRTLNQSQQEYLSAQNTENRLKSELDHAKAEEFQVNAGSAQLQMHQQEATSARQLYENLLRRLSEANAVAGLQQSNMQIVDLARVPSAPSSKAPRFYILASIVVGLFFSIALALVLNAVAGTVSTSADLYELTGLDFLGGIPTIQSKKAEGGNAAQIAFERPRSRASEAFYALRSYLLLSDSKGKPQVIAVTSPSAGEGKSVLCLNLAIVLAQRGAKVLLIDADLRCAMQHQYAGIPREPGLSSLLDGTATSSACIHAFNESLSLFVLPAGPPSPRPADLLDSVAMLDFLMNCRVDYDFVVIDTPPALIVSDLSILAKQSDGVLLVARSGVTLRRDLARTGRLLASLQERVLGVVLNEDPETSRPAKRTSRYFTYYEEAQ